MTSENVRLPKDPATAGLPPPPAKKPSVWQAFTQPAAWTMFFFGFSSGLPFLLVAGTLAYWLKENGIELKEITIIASAGMTYALKFLWAPLLDQTQLPRFPRLGLRRGWLLASQIVVIVGLLVMAMFTPAQLAAFIAATFSWRSRAPRRTSRSMPTASRSRRPPRRARWWPPIRSATASR